MGAFIKSRKTPRGFVLSGRGDEIEFAIETDEARYSQLSISRKNIAYLSLFARSLTQFALHFSEHEKLIA